MTAHPPGLPLLFTQPESALILARLRSFLRESGRPCYLVGGFLRDSFLYHPSTDIDVAVQGDPQPLGRQLARGLAGSYVPLSPDHGVARVVATDNAGREWQIDLSGFDGDIEQDLRRRDFSINALALPLDAWESGSWAEQVLDPLGGMADLSQKQVRATDAGVFAADPARLLRAVRLTAGLRFRLEPDTAKAVRENAFLIDRVAPERVRDEFMLILAGDGARGYVEVLDRLDLLCRIIPELEITKGVEQPRVHYWDVWGHSIHAVETAELVTKGHQNSAIYSLVPWTPAWEAHFNEEVGDGHTRRTVLKLTALLHDIAKPQTKAQDATGRTRFLGHSELGEEMVEARLGQLRFSSRTVSMVARMVRHHLRPTGMHEKGEMPTHRAIYRFFRDLEDVAVDTLYLAMADYLAAKGPEVMPDDWARHARMAAHILQVGTEQTGPEKPARLVNGHDLMQELGLEPGPQIGALIEIVTEAQAAGEIDTRQQALELAAASLGGRGKGE